MAYKGVKEHHRSCFGRLRCVHSEKCGNKQGSGFTPQTLGGHLVPAPSKSQGTSFAELLASGKGPVAGQLAVRLGVPKY